MERYLQYLISIILGLYIGWWLSTRSERKKSLKKVESLDVETFKKNMRKGQLIDLRKADDFKKDRIKGARNFKAGYLKSKRTTQVRKDQPLFIYCNSGLKANRLAKKLARKGYVFIYVLDGGFKAYKNEEKSAN
ncbi:rhodanese-like domain-containing protein [Liberiplasma polymorphum]|uniref:rhodanese-like domain-containing protein n=1 Tax=Liberiplasma polymorphum TaxID=3374570 RepID=UPI003771FB63